MATKKSKPKTTGRSPNNIKASNPGRPADHSTNAGKINPKHEKLCREYTDPASPGFGNKSRAAELAGLTAATGRRLLTQNDTVINRVAEIYAAAGAGQEVRGQRLAEILAGTYETRTTSTTSGVNGNGVAIELTSETVRTPTAAEVIKAIDVGNRADGTYQQQQAAADVIGAELKQLFRQQRREIARTGAKKSG